MTTAGTAGTGTGDSGRLPGSGADLGLSRLRSFVCLAEELHFGRAARRMHISQPALSQQIARLEKDLSTTLLRRTNRLVWLTPAGREFLKGARSALGILQDATAATRKRDSSHQPMVLSYVPTGRRHQSRHRPFIETFCAELESRILQTVIRPVRHSAEEQAVALREGDAYLGVAPVTAGAQIPGCVSAVITGEPVAGAADFVPLSLSWPSWASSAETGRLVSLARELWQTADTAAPCA